MIGPKLFEKVDQLFNEALDHPPEDRLRFVEERCQGDASLAAEVRKLLAVSDEDDGVFAGALNGPLWDELAHELQDVEHEPALAPGARVGPYEVVELVGRGGMGSVFRAKDPSLGRDVAIKALSHAFSGNVSTLRRFEREAKALARLNHPNIAAIYDLLHVEETRYLILEYVEGETLAERLARGPLELKALLPVAEQIAEALVEAHRKGLIHRDLKPSNIKFTSDGRVKVLDFGLAKSPDGPEPRSESHPAGLGAPTTQVGVVLGTPGYMSPEQARGESVDKRTDVWAYGCLLYEMLVGRPAFGGATASDAIASVLRDAVDYDELPASTPPELARLLRRCLRPDPRDRLQDIGDARLEVKELSRPGHVSKRAVVIPRSTSRWLVLAAATAFLAGMGFYRAVGTRQVQPFGGTTVRAELTVGPEERLWIGASGSIAVSPDGTRIAVVAVRQSRIQLFARTLDEHTLSPVRGSDGARDPFFSPDGKWVGFFAGGEMKKVALASGVTETVIATGLQPRGASWNVSEEIVYAEDGAPGIQLVSAIDKSRRALTDPSSSAVPQEHLWPQWVPGSRRVLFTVRTLGEPSNVTDELAVVDVDTGDVWRLGPGAQATPLDSGRVIYVREGGLETAVLSLDSPRDSMAGVRVVDTVNAYPLGASTYAAASAGVLLYLPRVESTSLHVTRLDGESFPIALPAGTPGWPRIAPDGRQAAVHIGGTDTRHVWLLDLERPGSSRQLTARDGGFPVWSPDGSRIAFMSRRAGTGDLYVIPADGSAPAELLLGGRTRIPVSWSSGGVLAYYELEDDTQRDIWLVDLDAGAEPVLFAGSPANELSPSFSPDGRFLAYVSNETGQNEVYVRPYPPPGPVVAVSIDGGSEPVWSVDGSALYYRRGGSIWSAPVRASLEFEVGNPVEIMSIPPLPGAGGNPSYDTFRDGSGFLVLRPMAGVDIDRLRLALNWELELDAVRSE